MQGPPYSRQGVAMVVLDEQDYISKVQYLLAQRNIYRPLAAKPTNKHKNKPINIARTIKAQGRLVDII